MPTSIWSFVAKQLTNFSDKGEQHGNTVSLPDSRSAHHANSENVVVLRDMPEVAKQYLAHWQSRWAQGQDWQSTY